MTKNFNKPKNPVHGKTFRNLFLNFRVLFAGFAIVIIALNSFSLSFETIKIRRQRQSKPFYFSGFKFLGLENFFHDVSAIGYLTDKDLSDKQNAAQFAQAQYLLAPTVLDLNNTNHRFILLDFTTEQKAMEKIKEIGAAPYKKNQYGIFLAQKNQ